MSGAKEESEPLHYVIKVILWIVIEKRKTMKDIKKPEFMKSAMTAKGHIAVLEILIALLVFLIGELVVSILQIPFLVVYLLTNKEYMSMLVSNSIDFEQVMQITMNLPDWITVLTLILEAGLIVVFILYCRIFEKRKAVSMGFRKKGFMIEYGKGIAIGAFMFLVAYALMVLTGSVEFRGEASGNFSILYCAAFFVGYLIQGMAEEVICRGYLMVSLSRRYSISYSVILSAAFFAALHGMNAGVGFLAFLNLFLFGIFMGLLMVRCENIWIVGAVHSIWNFVQGNILGIQVSGLRQQPSLFTSELAADRQWINGGAFGAEGGLAVTLVLGLSIAFLIWNMSKKEYFVTGNPIFRAYDYQQAVSASVENQKKDVYGMEQNPAVNPVRQQPRENFHENMGINPAETPWHPQEESPDEKKMTGFDQNYFKD